MNVSIKGGKSFLYQWDAGRILIAEHKNLQEVHFAHKNDAKALTVKATAAGDAVEANVPNILLQSAEDIMVYLVFRDDNGIETRKAVKIPVIARPKPDDYLYTETEVLSYWTLSKRIDEIEENGVSDEQIATAVEKYLDKNPSQGGATEEEKAQIQQNKTDIEKLTQDKLDATALPEAINEALAQAKETGEFKGEKGEKGDPGEPGPAYELTEADKQEIADMVEVPEGGTVTDEQIASAVEDYFSENPVTGGGGGMSSTAVNLLIKILKSAQYSEDQTANILALETALKTGDSGVVEPSESDVEQIGNILSIVSGVTVTQTDNILTIE